MGEMADLEIDRMFMFDPDGDDCLPRGRRRQRHVEDEIGVQQKRKSTNPLYDETIDRTRFWVTGDKRTVEIVKMTDSHLVNTIHWMLRSIGQYAEKVTFINRHLAGLTGDMIENLEFTERMWPDAEYSSSERFRAAADKWEGFVPMMNEAIRRGLVNNFPRA